MELATLRSMLATPSRGPAQRGAWMLSEDAQRRGWMAIRGLQRSWSAELTSVTKRRSEPQRSGARGRFQFVPPAGKVTLSAIPSGAALVRAKEKTENLGRPQPTPRETDGEPSAACAELFVCEPVIRLWCLLLIEYAESRHCETARQFARNLIVAQYQTRQLAMTAVMATPEPPVSGSHSRNAKTVTGNELPAVGASLDRLRRVGERWTDLLLANRMAHPQTAELVFDADRAEEFSDRLALLPTSPQPAGAWELALVSVRTVYPAFPFSQAPRSELARGLAEALLATFPPAAFTSGGCWLPAWVASWKRFGLAAP